MPVWRAQVPDDPRSDAEIKAQEVDRFRQLHPAQTRFMFNLSDQALRCVKSRAPVTCPRYGFEMDGNTLILRLPSGRPLFYPRARIVPGRFGRDAVAYHNPAKNHEDETWYGTWLAHLVSATARDLLVNALFNLDAAGFDIILHVHDEIVAEIDPANAEHDRERFKARMLQAPAWATGLPLAAKVRIGARYLKTDTPASTIETTPAHEIAANSNSQPHELPAGPESDRNPVPPQPSTSEPVHICRHCKLNGPEPIASLGGEWLHPGCTDAFMQTRMAEEGVAWDDPSRPLQPPSAPTASLGPAAPLQAPGRDRHPKSRGRRLLHRLLHRLQCIQGPQIPTALPVTSTAPAERRRVAARPSGSIPTSTGPIICGSSASICRTAIASFSNRTGTECSGSTV